MAEASNEMLRSATETMDLVDSAGRALNQEAQRGISATLNRAEAAGRKLDQAATGIADSILRGYQMMFSFRAARRLSEAYMEMNERMARESIDFNRRLVELWFDGTRKLWQAAEEGQREATNDA
jgi:hypothetical protein